MPAELASPEIGRVQLYGISRCGWQTSRERKNLFEMASLEQSISRGSIGIHLELMRVRIAPALQNHKAAEKSTIEKLALVEIEHHSGTVFHGPAYEVSHGGTLPHGSATNRTEQVTILHWSDFKRALLAHGELWVLEGAAQVAANLPSLYSFLSRVNQFLEFESGAM